MVERGLPKPETRVRFPPPAPKIMFKPADLFDLTQTEHAAIFADCKFAWDALKKIEAYLAQAPKQSPPKRFPGASIGEKVFIGEGTVVENGAMIKGPAIIGKNCQI